MTASQVLQHLKDRLARLAEQETCEDAYAEEHPDEYFTAYDWYGSNVDDSYHAGKHTGEIELARELLEEINRL